jgi:predicted kinase
LMCQKLCRKFFLEKRMFNKSFTVYNATQFYHRQEMHQEASEIIVSSIAAVREVAELLLKKLKARMPQYKLELHPHKTKIVHSKKLSTQ